MNCKIFILPLILIGFTYNTQAQKNIPKENVIRFRSSIVIGTLDGERGTSFQLQSINGIAYKTYSAGIGLGLDYYFMRSIPLFIQLEKSLTKNNKSPFVYGNVGTNFPWIANSNKILLGQTNVAKGPVYEFGFGYKLSVLKNSSLLFSAGYSFKQLSQNLPGTPIIFDQRYNWMDYTQHYVYSLRRLTIKAGLIF